MKSGGRVLRPGCWARVSCRPTMPGRRCAATAAGACRTTRSCGLAPATGPATPGRSGCSCAWPQYPADRPERWWRSPRPSVRSSGGQPGLRSGPGPPALQKYRRALFLTVLAGLPALISFLSSQLPPSTGASPARLPGRGHARYRSRTAKAQTEARSSTSARSEFPRPVQCPSHPRRTAE